MSKKVPRNQRRKQAEAAAPAAPTATPGEVVRRRRNRRMIFLGLIAVLLPLLEVAAYRFRSILIVVVNDSDEVVTNVKVSYPGGSFAAQELKPGAELTELARPDFTFTSAAFSTYLTQISFSSADGGLTRLAGRTGTVDYSARETFALRNDGPNGVMEIKHTTHPGFPLGAIRDLLTKLGVH